MPYISNLSARRGAGAGPLSRAPSSLRSRHFRADRRREARGRRVAGADTGEVDKRRKDARGPRWEPQRGGRDRVGGIRPEAANKRSASPQHGGASTEEG